MIGGCAVPCWSSSACQSRWRCPPARPPRTSSSPASPLMRSRPPASWRRTASATRAREMFAARRLRHGERRGDRGRDVGGERQVREGVELQRQQQHRDGAGRGVAGSDDGDDRRRRGSSPARSRATGGPCCSSRGRRRDGLRPLRQRHGEREPPDGRDQHRRRQDGGRYRDARDRRVDAHRGDLRRREPALLRQRRAGRRRRRRPARSRRRPGRCGSATTRSTTSPTAA